jgi:hypothetical protein
MGRGHSSAQGHKPGRGARRRAGELSEHHALIRHTSEHTKGVLDADAAAYLIAERQIVAEELDLQARLVEEAAELRRERPGLFNAGADLKCRRLVRAWPRSADLPRTR